VHQTERRRERHYGSGAFDVWRLACVEFEFALFDAERQVPIDFREVPRELSD
jgi:hypothetical protein